MIRILIFLVCVVAIGAGLSFAASVPGELVMMVGNSRIVTSPFTALCLLLLLIAVILFILWLIRIIIRAPRTLRNRLGERRQERGFQALGSGLIAVMSGDVKSARRLTKQSHKLLDAQSQPLLHLLAAETKRLESDHDAAIEIFRTMCEDPQMRLIGLKGLYREAVKNGEEENAGRYAAQAAKISPSLEWASRAGITNFARDGAWEEALLLLDRHEKALTKSRIKELDLTHWRVVLMCAQARDIAQTNDPTQARDIAFKAQRLKPDFIPAATIAAQIAFRLGEQRKGCKLIESLWQKIPHPDLAQSYIDASDRSPSEKLRLAQKLARFNPDHYLSHMLVARTAFAAKDYPLAREQAEAAAKTTAFASIFLLLADIEAAQTGNQAEIQKFLTHALHAPADPVWIVDGEIMAEWVAVSPITHQIGGCLWQQPAKAPTILTLDRVEEGEEPLQNLASPNIPPLFEPLPENAPLTLSSITNENPIEFLPDVELIDDTSTDKEATPKVVTRLIVDDPGVIVKKS